MLYSRQDFRLRLTRAGRLLPWIGPALRGLVALPFRERVCQFSREERQTRWERCTGCPHMLGCAYGQTLEPDPPAEVTVPRGREDAARPVVMSPYFPVPEQAVVGLDLPLSVLAVGQRALSYLPALLGALTDAGQTRGLGEDGVTFDLVSLPSREVCRVLSPSDFPTSPNAIPGRLPRLGIGLTSPLFLKSKEGGRKRSIEIPSCADLLRASLRSVSELFRLYGEKLVADYRALAEVAEEVQLLEHCYERFEQDRHSSRSGDYPMRGVVGGGIYSDVPMSLLPWLLWGGRVHVAGHRVAGAGGWRLMLE